MTDEMKKRQALQLQWVIAGVFLGLGGWCLAAPQNVIELTANPDQLARSPLLTVTVGAFGAQAMLFGLISATARYTARSFLALAFALLPFFVFDWWFYAVEPLFNEFILLDAAGNVVMLTACLRGWSLLRKAESKA